MVLRLKFGNKSSKKETLTLERLNEVLYIDSKVGKCYWRVSNTNSVKVGDRAGCIHKSSSSEDLSYRVIRIDKKQYKEHILIWFFVTGKWPLRDLDHKDTDGLNNRYKNLRLCTNSQNNGNTGLRKNNTSGFKGVSWHEPSKKWVVYICYKGKRMNLGGFDDPYKAHLRYCKIHRKLFGEFSRTK
jgi:hypothetical protein